MDVLIGRLVAVVVAELKGLVTADGSLELFFAFIDVAGSREGG